MGGSGVFFFFFFFFCFFCFLFLNSINSARMPIFSTRHVDEIIVTEWCAIFRANLKTRIKITKKSGHMNSHCSCLIEQYNENIRANVL